MSEKSMRSTLMQKLKPLHPIPVENSVYPGTPDINYLFGWLELKYERSWPKNKNTPLRVRHFTPQQRLWIRQRKKFGGIVYVVLKVRYEWLFLDPLPACNILGNATRDELLDITLLHFPFTFDDQAVLDFLKQ